MVRRKGLGRGTGKGYKNVLGKDSSIHSQSSRGIKQPIPINESRLNSIDRNIKQQCPLCKEWLYDDETHYVCEPNIEDLKKEYKELLDKDIEDNSIGIENVRTKKRMREIQEYFRKQEAKELNLVRVEYGFDKTKKEDREYQINGKGAVGTLKEFKETFPFVKLNVKDIKPIKKSFRKTMWDSLDELENKEIGSSYKNLQKEIKRQKI